jgi:hypothetical protein
MTRRAWILWFMLALLPLRGWATAAAEVSLHAREATHAVALATDTDTASYAPCHGHDAAPAHDGDHASGAASTGHAGCSVPCDLCHGGFVLVHDALWPRIDLPEPAPAAKPARDTGRRLVGGLERPPRFALV